MPGQHKHTPLRFRPPEAEREWLLDHAEATGKPVNAILTEALSEYRTARTSPPHDHSTDPKDSR